MKKTKRRQKPENESLSPLFSYHGEISGQEEIQSTDKWSDYIK